MRRVPMPECALELFAGQTLSVRHAISLSRQPGRELLPGSRQVPAHRHGCDTQQRGYPSHRLALEFVQHDNGTPTRVQSCERVTNSDLGNVAGFRTVARLHLGVTAVPMPDSRPPRLVTRDIDKGCHQPGVLPPWVWRQWGPRPQDSRKRLLHQVFGIGVVGRQSPSEPEEPLLVRVEQPERLLVFAFVPKESGRGGPHNHKNARPPKNASRTGWKLYPLWISSDHGAVAPRQV